MKRWIQNEKGSILVFAAALIGAGVLFAATAIDVSYILTARNQLQCAVDASALAGASGLRIDEHEAISQAIKIGNQNTCIDQIVRITSEEISFPEDGQICVSYTQTLNLFFARLIGMKTTNVSATAVAELSTIVGTPGTRPWAIPDLGWPTGATVLLKSGSIGASNTNASFYYAVDYPPVNRGTPVSGADQYRENIALGTEHDVFVADILQIEPGNMIGPTKHGVQELLALDPNAYWNGQDIVNSDFPGYSSPRVVKIPLYPDTFTPDPGRNNIEVIGLGSFFLVGLQGSDVMGVYIEKMDQGTYGEGYSFLYGARLIG
ncbi:Tad domain-containing protein [candidate division KSB1 bacterium]|nr:Tad domain-containing protein [candidate division KSB1 bacterium]